MAWLYCIDPTKTGDISPEYTSGPNKGKPNPNSGMVWKHGGMDPNAKPDKYGRRLPLFGRTLSNVAVDSGLVIAVGIGGAVYCLDAKTGKLYWAHDTKGYCFGSPLIVDGKVFVSAAHGGVWILDLAKEKKVIGPIEKDCFSQCSPVFANGVLYVASERHLYAIAGNERGPAK